MARPLTYSTAEEMSVKIDAYFENCKNKDLPKILTSMCVHLGITTETLAEYEGKKEGLEKISISKAERAKFSRIIKLARLTMLSDLQEGSLTGKYKETSAIWLQKVNHGLKEPDREKEPDLRPLMLTKQQENAINKVIKQEYNDSN